MKTLLKYDFFYMRKTSRIIIIGAVILFFAILSPITAKYMNELLDVLLEDSGLVIELTTPTVIDSYAQYIGNLYELILYVLIFMSVGMFIRDKTKGVLPLVLSKPIDRNKYILSKFIVFNSIVFVVLLLGYLVFGYYTFFLFDQVDMGLLFTVTLLFMVYLLFITSIAMFSSMVTKSYPIAILITFVVYIFMQILSIGTIGIMKFLPGHIITRISELIANIHTTSDVWWTAIVTLLLSIGMIVLSMVQFKKVNI